MEHVQQRSVEWYNQRLGRFTASEITRLLGKLTTATGLKAFESYCMEKATESVFGLIEDEYTSFDMQRGIDTEPYAFDAFYELMGEQFIEVRKSGFVNYGDHAGASPDGLVGEKDDLEIKCPNAKNFFKLAITREVPENHYAQMQMQLLCLGGDKAYYFNYLTHQGEPYHFTIEVPRDEAMITLIKERIEMAIELKLKYIEALKSTLIVTPIDGGMLVSGL